MARTKQESTLSRRQFLRYSGAAGLAGALAWPYGRTLAFGGYDPAAGTTVTLPFENGSRPVVQYPEKRPLLQLTTRATQLETPFSVFDGSVLTPNDAHYVRYHNSYQFGGPLIGPQTIDGNTFRLNVGGNVATPLSLSVADLKTKFNKFEIVAVNQCSGNSRGFFAPRVRGGQWANGAMANARWTGVALRDVLNQARVGPGAVQVAFSGLDESDGDSPDFEKALDLGLAMNGEVMLAYAMNGEELPMLNGFPLRLVVPGYYATYWVKHLNQITVVDAPYDTYYMTTAYRIPDTACACVPPGTLPSRTVPIGKMNVRSFITSMADGDTVSWLSLMLKGMTVRGIAFDGGSGIKRVEFSSDGGASWRTASLGLNYGNYSFRQWSTLFWPPGPGQYVLKVRAVNNAGETQALEPLWNPSGFMRNVVETVRVKVV